MINLKKILIGTAAIAIAFGGFIQQPAEAGNFRDRESSIVKRPRRVRYRTRCFTYKRTRRWLYQQCRKLKCVRRGRRYGVKCRLVRRWKKRIFIGRRPTRRFRILSNQ